MRKKHRRLHDFRDSSKKTIPYTILTAVLDMSADAIRQWLMLYDSPPDNVHDFVSTVIKSANKRDFESAIKGGLMASDVAEPDTDDDKNLSIEELDRRIKEEKLREIVFKNERTEGKYVLQIDVQLALDNFLIALRTNLEALPDALAQTILSCRDESEAREIMLEAIANLTKDFADNPIQTEPDVTED